MGKTGKETGEKVKTIPEIGIRLFPIGPVFFSIGTGFQSDGK
jgi:hypothetical protein